MSEERREREADGAEPARAWERFCEALDAAGRGVAASAAPGHRAEGFRHLAGLAVAGLRQAFELDDPLRPRFLRNPDSSSKWGAENADNQYLWTRIDPRLHYRIEGLRNSAFDFLIEVKEGYMQLGEARNFATLSASEIRCGPDGRFEVLASARRQAGNWLPLHPEARYLAIRQFFWDWEREEPARFRIHALEGEGLPPAAPEPAAVAARLDAAARWVGTTARFWPEWVERLRAAHRPGELAPARSHAGGAEAILYGNDLYRLGAGEALLVETEPPRARYWSFQLCSLWFESLDYANRQTSLNGHQARLDSDGRLRCVVAHRDPGVPNWLDTAGHEEGVIQYRWVWSRDNPRPRLRVVPLASLRAELPPDTPQVSPEQRRRAIRARQEHVARREPSS